jgi:hypothetical protein
MWQKSLALQLKFIEAIHAWQQGSPIPIYFNLATAVPFHPKNILPELNKGIETNITPFLATVHLYIDSYDEGMTEGTKDKIIQCYYSELGSNLPYKILITCCANAISESDHDLFAPANRKLQKAYVAAQL